MKVWIFTLLMLFAAAVFAQDEVTPPGGNGEDGEGSAFLTQCQEGEIIFYPNGDFYYNLSCVACNIGDELPGACQTKIEIRPSSNVRNYHSVNRICTTREACMNNADGNRPKCYPGENGVRLCFFCCNTHKCNNFVNIPDEVVIEDLEYYN